MSEASTLERLGTAIIHIERGVSARRISHVRTVTDGSGTGDVFHVQFDPGVDSIVSVIVRSVASIHNVEPSALPPLSDAVDPEMLERVVDPEANQGVCGADVTFQYVELLVTVDAKGDLWLEWD